MPNTRPSCFAIPSSRIAALWWVRAQYPATWRSRWRRLVRTWGAS